MKTTSHRITKFALLLGACAVLASQTVRAQLMYHVTVDTAALNLPAVSGNGPFSLDLQLNYGGLGLAENATVSNFAISGGSVDETNVFIDGNITGSLNTGVTFVSADSSTPFNLFAENFTPGDTLSFDLLLSNNASAGSTSGFVIAIDDGSLDHITTTDPSGSLATLQIHGEEVAPANRIEVDNFAGAGDYDGVTISVQQVPEPSAWALLIAGAAVLGLRLRVRKV